MATVEFNGKIDKIPVSQGDIVYCKSTSTGSYSFWGICNRNTIISLDGGGSSCVYGDDMYLGFQCNYWIIDKIIPCDKVNIIIQEKQ